MATGQTMLDTMEVMDRGLQLQSGETGVTLALRALNAAQDHFESLMSLELNAMASSIGTVTTSADTESTAFPTGLIRLDRLQFIDPDTSRPAWDLERVGPVGDYSTGGTLSMYSNSTVTGKPVRYWTNGSHIYWNPLPDATHTVRYYGMKSASDITAAGTFAYPDIVMLPIVQFAVRLLRIGKDDEAGPIIDVGMQIFGPVIKTLGNFNRDRPPGYDYRYAHTE
jgi:hypothetical protein|tara:strand:+ start:50 stop:721 length:672 start_codon:yes stop_codon:yes gene_type:complete